VANRAIKRAEQAGGLAVSSIPLVTNDQPMQDCPHIETIW